MRRTLTVLSLAISAITACMFSTSVLAVEQVINLYSARHYPTDEALYSDFTKVFDPSIAYNGFFGPSRSSYDLVDALDIVPFLAEILPVQLQALG